MIELIIFAIGLILGSFCNVVIYRLPQGKSIVMPGSQCRSCGSPIRPWENIPVLSFFWLGMRCRVCKDPISTRYPAVECISGILLVLLYLQFEISITFVVYGFLTLALLIIAFIDFDHKIIPNTITLPGIAAGFCLSVGALPITPLASLSGLTVGGTIFYLIAFISKGGMGGGDIKLIAMIGAFLGLEGVLFTIFTSALLGSVVGITLMVFHKAGRKDLIPFGPFLSCGAILYMLIGDYLIERYFRMLS